MTSHIRSLSPYHRSSDKSRNLIINGEDAKRGRYPYFVLIDQYCGGSLIAPDIVACAGHCLPSHHHQHDILIYVGMYDRKDGDQDDDDDNDDDDDDVEVFEIANMIRHPDWHRIGDDSFASDFALIQLNGTSSKPLVRINRDPHLPFPGQDIVAMGMGITNARKETFAEKLQQVVIQPVSNEECAASRGSGRRRDISYEGQIDDSMLCTTGGEHNERDACDYDSGSPMIIPGNGHNKPDTVVAMVSWGELCADPDFPGVNVRISNASAWIDEMVCNMSAVPPADFRCRNHNNSPGFDFKSLSSQHVVGPFVLVSIICAVLQFKCKLLKGRAKPFRDDDSNSTAEEQEELVAGPYHTRRGSSYDSIGIEVTETSDD